MNKGKFIICMIILALWIPVTIISCNEEKNDPVKIGSAQLSLNKEALENEAWQMEEKYWDCVLKNDTVTYKKLWHDDFIGYPAFGDSTSRKSGIAIWIPKLHADKNLAFKYQLHKKAVNAIDDIVMVFYDADYTWTDKNNTIVRKETSKFTHTWKKYGETWFILGGMAAKKK